MKCCAQEYIEERHQHEKIVHWLFTNYIMLQAKGGGGVFQKQKAPTETHRSRQRGNQLTG